jgi:hypothetical protein
MTQDMADAQLSQRSEKEIDDNLAMIQVGGLEAAL